MKLRVLDIRGPADLPGAFEAIRRESSDALVLISDPMLFAERPHIVQLAARQRVLAVYETRPFAEAGGLLSYGPLSQQRFERMAVYVDRILRGARAGDLPIERPTTFGLVVNAKAAAALGLTLPPAILQRADEVIR